MAHLRIVVILCFALLGIACGHGIRQAQGDTAATEQMGPRVISRPGPNIDEYYVEVKPEFDHRKYAETIAARVDGKVGYIYQNFHAFTVHTIPESAVDRLRRMPEVLSVRKATIGTLD